MTLEYIVKNNYFKAIVANANTYINRNYINDLSIYIYRLDTLEPYSNLYISSDNQKNCFTQVQKFIEKLGRPVDWKKLHRYCIARYVRQVFTDDFFYGFFDCNSLTNVDIRRYMLGSRLKETVLIKKLNQLSDEEKKQLFILKEWEIENHLLENVTYAIYGREYLYERLYDKEKYRNYYQKYFEKVESEFGKIDMD